MIDKPGELKGTEAELLLPEMISPRRGIINERLPKGRAVNSRRQWVFSLAGCQMKNMTARGNDTTQRVLENFTNNGILQKSKHQLQSSALEALVLWEHLLKDQQLISFSHSRFLTTSTSKNDDPWSFDFYWKTTNKMWSPLTCTLDPRSSAPERE